VQWDQRGAGRRLAKNGAAGVGETEVTLKAIGDGMSASGSALIEASVAGDLSATATSFKIPYYVIQGRHDLFAPTPLVDVSTYRITETAGRYLSSSL
jgi:hypothetical protein